jgi:N-methylhydantoinase B
MVDAVTFDFVRGGLPSIAKEMAHVIRKTSFNMMLYEVGDFSCSVVGPDGTLWAQNEGAVSHFAADVGPVIGDAVERGIPFADGDVFVTNHQRYCGQHLNNMCVYMPVFLDGRLIGFTFTRAHWVDVGGMSTGFGGGALSKDPWIEGLQLDHIKVRDADGDRTEALRFILDNVRFPENTMGDLNAQIAACTLGARRLRELWQRVGEQDLTESIAEMMSDAEQRCRSVVAAMPDGEFTSTGRFLDHAADTDEPLLIKVKVTIAGSDMTIDFTGSSTTRRSPVNARTLAGAYIAYKALTRPLDPVNQGSFGALRVVMPEGTFMMASYPAPMAKWSIALPTVVDTVLSALAEVLPDKVPAQHKGAMGDNITFFGTEGARKFVVQSIEGGGWGGKPFADGESASVTICQGDVCNSPIEALELKYPILIEGRELRGDTGGPGEFRGGLGVDITVRNLLPGTWSLSQTGRKGMPALGVAGGMPGGDTDRLLRVAGTDEFVSVDGPRIDVPADSVAVIRTGGGGGWGDPSLRSVESVLRDVGEGFVSVESAARDYGVAVSGSGHDLAIDEQATARLRAAAVRG